MYGMKGGPKKPRKPMNSTKPSKSKKTAPGKAKTPPRKPGSRVAGRMYF